MTLRRAIGIAVLLATSTPALGRVGGGSVPATDCLAEFDGITETAPGIVACADGDPCDGDGVVDGVCQFRISVCAFQTDRVECTPSPIRKFDHNKRHLALPPVPVTEPTCGATTTVRVPLRGNGAHQRASLPKVVRLRARSTDATVDANRFQLQCLPHRPGTSTTVTSLTSTTTSSSTSTTSSTMICGAPCQATGDGPAQLDLTVTVGSDLDLGWTGVSHDFLVPIGTTIRFCASGCDATTDPLCDLTGSTGNCSLNGPAFGPPLPLVAGGLPVCVVNKYSQATITGQGNLQTGEITTQVNLSSEVWTTPTYNVCPKCSGATVGASGTCNIGPRKNQACTTEGIVTLNSDNPPISGAVYTLSHDCPPGGLAQTKIVTIPVDLYPLTTGASSLPGPRPCQGQTQDDGCGGAACTASCAVAPPLKGGVHQFCCANGQQSPCFPTKTGAIARSGQLEYPTPAWPDPSYPKTGVGGASGEQLASIFCVPKTDSTLDGVTGLPGPGAVVLPVRQCWRKPGQPCP